jgi:hypothetical protein
MQQQQRRRPRRSSVPLRPSGVAAGEAASEAVAPASGSGVRAAAVRKLKTMRRLAAVQMRPLLAGRRQRHCRNFMTGGPRRAATAATALGAMRPVKRGL